jgi:O-antigen/teichoic acid export membrane protein
VGVLRATAAGLERWNLVATEQAISAASRICAISALALAGLLTPVHAGIVTFVAPLIGGLAYLPLARRGSVPLSRDGDGRTRWSPLLSYGSRVWLGAISGILLARIDQTILAPLSTTEAVGLYVAAVAYSEIPLIAFGAIRDVTFSRYARDGTYVDLARIARISGLLCVAIGIALIALAPLVVPLIFGHDFAGAVVPAIVLVVAVVVGPPGSIAGVGLAARGRPGLRSLSLVVACVLNVAAILVLAPILGALGAAIATLVGNLASSNLNIAMLSRRSDFGFRNFYRVRGADVRDARTLIVTMASQIRHRDRTPEGPK